MCNPGIKSGIFRYVSKKCRTASDIETPHDITTCHNLFRFLIFMSRDIQILTVINRGIFLDHFLVFSRRIGIPQALFLLWPLVKPTPMFLRKTYTHFLGSYFSLVIIWN